MGTTSLVQMPNCPQCEAELRSNDTAGLGNIFENVSAVDANGVGPYTQTLTFTSGTKEFTGATGLVSGSGNRGTTGYTVSGSGINAPAVPEPPSNRRSK